MFSIALDSRRKPVTVYDPLVLGWLSLWLNLVTADR